MTTGAGDEWLPALLLGGGALIALAGVLLLVARRRARPRLRLVAWAVLAVGVVAVLVPLVVISQSGGP